MSNTDLSARPLGEASTTEPGQLAAAGSSKTVWINADDPQRAANHVEFRSYWTLEGTEHEALSILLDYENISGWWGRTFLDTPVLHRPGDGLIGLVGHVTSRGYLPYIFQWRAEVIAASDDAVTLSAVGDFEGTGTFRRPNEGEAADLCFDWNVRIQKPILKVFCPLACRIYLWNHAYAMADGARSLQAEILRKRS